ncbi:hypothetical protein CCP3SC1_100045 [Gammaproteobacteria bacterium]
MYLRLHRTDLTVFPSLWEVTPAELMLSFLGQCAGKNRHILPLTCLLDGRGFPEILMKETSSASERRRFTRVPFDTRAQITRRDQVIEVILLDLCLQGALIELSEVDSPLPTEKTCGILNRGERVKLELLLDEVDTIISMDTEVAYVHEKNVGLRCRALDLDSITHLRRLVELNLGDAELFQREIALLGQPIAPSTSEGGGEG